MDLNELARRVAEQEGLKKQVNIAQIKEVIKHTLIMLGYHFPDDVLATIQRIHVKHTGTRAWE